MHDLVCLIKVHEGLIRIRHDIGAKIGNQSCSGHRWTAGSKDCLDTICQKVRVMDQGADLETDWDEMLRYQKGQESLHLFGLKQLGSSWLVTCVQVIEGSVGERVQSLRRVVLMVEKWEQVCHV